MKKFLFACVCILCLSSCYNTRILVGDVKPKDPVIEVNREWNHHLLYGLIPVGKTARMEVKNYLPENENYVVKTNMTFLNGLVGWITCGIYTPTNTVYYVPLKDINNKN